ncbi:MAG TPA: bifunctional oligoribonuclease/PAP phosphatase NrnA [Fimbriimonas sp.]|nr:bifunctional oligoribonuclease/PAP phosphatase NrnA [Fimbriimonas sp.]
MIDGKRTAGAFQEELSRASSVLIGTHMNPDGDALGSALALSHHLDAVGIDNEVICHHSAPRNLRFLPGLNRVRQIPKEPKYDLGVVLDLDSLDRLGNTAEFFAGCSRLIVIDHHVPHEKPGDLRIVDTSAPATAVILTRLLIDMGARITPEISTCLLTGIVTDTGSFRFRNTTPEALSLSAYLLEHGGDLTMVQEEIFQSKSLASARLLGRSLETMRLECANQIAWSTLSSRDFEMAEATDEDTEGFVNELLFITSVQVAALLREPKPGKVRCSLRSRGDFDVAAVARTFGGGGHKNAAGCTIDGPLEEAEELLVRGLKQCLGYC